MAEKEIEPDTARTIPIVGKKVGGFSNGQSVFASGSLTVAGLKEKVYGKGKVPTGVRAGCHGRMFEDSDNLALAVKAFCRRDPMIVLWGEVTEQQQQ